MNSEKTLTSGWDIMKNGQKLERMVTMKKNALMVADMFNMETELWDLCNNKLFLRRGIAIPMSPPHALYSLLYIQALGMADPGGELR